MCNRSNQKVKMGSFMWHDRVEQWERNVIRAHVMLDATLAPRNQALAGRYRVLLNSLSKDLEALRDAAKVGGLPQRLWNDLVALDRQWRDVFGTLLDLLGGVAITDSNQGPGVDRVLVAKAQTWLDALRKELGLDRELVVVPAPGPLLHTKMGVVCVPLLEWDWLRLPLLGRALGLLAAAEDAVRGGHLAVAADLLRPEVQALQYGEPPRPLTGPDGWERRYIDHLFADMFATVVLGPLYVIATFVLDLEWAVPEQPSLDDPDVVEDRAAKPRFLPSPAARAVAMLTTLQALDTDPNRPVHQPGPYAGIIGKLGQLVRTAGADLASAAARWDAWHTVILESVMPHYAGHLGTGRLGNRTRQIWQTAETNYWHWSRSEQGSRLSPLTAPDPSDFTTLLSGIWLYRLHDPKRTEMLREATAAVLQGRDAFLPPPGLRTDAITDARLDHAVRRWQQFQAILENPAVFPTDRAAMAGRFLRLLSDQVYSLEEAQAQVKGAAGVPAVWRPLRDVEEKARPLQREALEFLAGLLVEDREPASLAGGAVGPSIRALADDLLRDYAVRTGVNWSAQTVLGRDPFVEPHTDVIRVRFPDWSLWSLPLVAHEFGHLVAQATPRFRREQRQLRGAAAGAEPAAQFEELFADVFAVYTMGPAFACDAILLEFNPAQAYEPRGRHPTHAERVCVILQTLREMNERTRGAGNSGEYASIIELLEGRWSMALADIGAPPPDDTIFAREKRSRAWGIKLFGIVERYYRLGAGYLPKRWTWALEESKRLIPLVTSVPELRQSVRAYRMRDLHLLDLLNVLWCARARLYIVNPDLAHIQSVATQLGREYAAQVRA
jgi:hypothetical protein